MKWIAFFVNPTGRRISYIYQSAVTKNTTWMSLLYSDDIDELEDLTKFCTNQIFIPTPESFIFLTI